MFHAYGPTQASTGTPLLNSPTFSIGTPKSTRLQARAFAKYGDFRKPPGKEFLICQNPPSKLAQYVIVIRSLETCDQIAFVKGGGGGNDQRLLFDLITQLIT